jgi:hypothetical protein
VSEETHKCEETTWDGFQKAGYSYAETKVIEKKFTKPVNVSMSPIQFFNKMVIISNNPFLNLITRVFI